METHDSGFLKKSTVSTKTITETSQPPAPDHEILTWPWPVTPRLLDMHKSSQVGREVEIVPFLEYA